MLYMSIPLFVYSKRHVTSFELVNDFIFFFFLLFQEVSSMTLVYCLPNYKSMIRPRSVLKKPCHWLNLVEKKRKRL